MKQPRLALAMDLGETDCNRALKLNLSVSTSAKALAELVAGVARLKGAARQGLFFW